VSAPTREPKPAAQPPVVSIGEFNRLIAEALTEGPKPVTELYQLALERQPQDCPNVACPLNKTTKRMEWQHEIQRQLARFAANRDGLWYFKTGVPLATNPPVAVAPVAYTGDPYIVTAEGLPEWARTEAHFMDMEELKKAPEDRFVVPNDFEEFCAWKPDYVLRWVKKRLNRVVVDHEMEDWAQDLLTHLSQLPSKSKYRQVGKKDIVQTFDPLRHHGTNEARFRNYINRCLANKFSTMRSKRMKDALSRPGNLSLAGETEHDDFRAVDDEYCHLHSAHLRTVVKIAEKRAFDEALLQEFVNFVQREDPKVRPMIEALRATGTQADTTDWLGMTQPEFGRMLKRLRQLRKCFVSGEPVPKQRRPYKKRVTKTVQFSRSRVAA
jgi:hypothetical protein